MIDQSNKGITSQNTEYEVLNSNTQTLPVPSECVVCVRRLSIKKLRGQCYDGAGAISGSRSEVAKKISDLESRAVYTQCYGHSLNLACMDTYMVHLLL